jgi:hypothetical protein
MILMTKGELNMAFDRMTPDDTQKERMLNTVLSSRHPAAQASKPKKARRKVWAGAAAACLALALTMIFVFQPGGGVAAFALSVTIPDGSTVLLEDKAIDNRPSAPAASVSYVDSRPQLRFFITGENIAKIEISCENEYLKAHDFTEKLDEKYWNPELYYEEQQIDGTIYQYVPTRSLLDKSHVLLFPKNFDEYDQIWYDWYAWDLMEWASEDDFSHYQSYNGLSSNEIEEKLASMSEEERLAIAAGGGGTSTAGHILLDGYPEDNLNDRITITITDRQGNTVTKKLLINVRNNEIGQTVVSASLAD